MNGGGQVDGNVLEGIDPLTGLYDRKTFFAQPQCDISTGQIADYDKENVRNFLMIRRIEELMKDA